MKDKNEVKAFRKMSDKHPELKEFIDLCTEFNNQKTREAKFVKQLDKLEMILQAFEYQKEGYIAQACYKNFGKMLTNI